MLPTWRLVVAVVVTISETTAMAVCGAGEHVGSGYGQNTSKKR
jgi:hypothetical protein